MSEAVVCTLFEGHYHYGFAGLVNSLYANGYRGDIYAGYRGKLPTWADNKTSYHTVIKWNGATTLQVNDALQIHFLPVETKFQFTNYKPEFVLQLAESKGFSSEKIFYFDPDIVVKCNWEFFLSWTSFGIALVHEIINHDMPESHPVRRTWTKIIEDNDITVKRQPASYINAGFFGFKISDIQFAELYKKFVEVSINDYGIDVEKFCFYTDRSYPFFAKDQDALNLAAMCCDAPISEYGPEAMDFLQGGKVMSHAIGSPKPWKKDFFLMALKGSPPSLAEKEYWKYANGIIITYSNALVKYKHIAIKMASFIGRFYRKY